ncbi:MAG: 50S ribosomal protein L10 [Bdellovibrionales bacterium]|nr:50S ribosomal protein L10 [Bdellovibrionales bacterium]
MITKVKQEEQVKYLSESMKKAKAGFLVNFQGLSVQQITEMRKDLRNKGLADMKVCRNTLIRKALSAWPEAKEHVGSQLTGSNAFILAFEDPSRVAKILYDYVKKTEVLQIKAGVLEGKGIGIQDIKTLATLPSMEVLRAQLLSMLSAPMSQLLSVFSAVPQGLLRVFDAYKDKGK